MCLNPGKQFIHSNLFYKALLPAVRAYQFLHSSTRRLQTGENLHATALLGSEHLSQTSNRKAFCAAHLHSPGMQYMHIMQHIAEQLHHWCRTTHFLLFSRLYAKPHISLPLGLSRALLTYQTSSQACLLHFSLVYAKPHISLLLVLSRALSTC